jgi:hypothetical protein
MNFDAVSPWPGAVEARRLASGPAGGLRATPLLESPVAAPLALQCTAWPVPFLRLSSFFDS